MANANSNIYVRPKLHTFLNARSQRQLSEFQPIRQLCIPTNTDAEARTLLTGIPLMFVFCKPQECCHVE